MISYIISIYFFVFHTKQWHKYVDHQINPSSCFRDKAYPTVLKVVKTIVSKMRAGSYYLEHV